MQNNSHKKFKQFFKGLALATAVLTTTQYAAASTATEKLSDCLVKSTTSADKVTVLQWTFVALSFHPDLKAYSQVTTDQKEQLDKNLAQVLQRIIVDQCSAETRAVIQADGIQAVGDSFQELGQITGEEILKNPEVKQQLKGVVKHIDLNKLVSTFLTPEVFKNLGVIR
jgi:hypothetical protein